MKLTIKIDNAIQALEKNLQEHVVELTEAIDVWGVDVIKAIEELRDAVNRVGLKASHVKLTQLFYHSPKDSRADYARFIGALKRSKADGQEYVEIDENDYDRMFNDNWEWRVQSKISNAAYKK